MGAQLSVPNQADASLLSKACGIVGTIGEGWWGKACNVLTGGGGKLVSAAKSLATGKPGKVIKDLLGGAAKNVLSPSGAAGIAAIVAWVVGGAHFVLSEISKLIGESTSPELTAAWFSSVYLRVAGVAALLTLPFLCAAAIQAVLRGDGGLLTRSVFGYLPLSFLATGVAAPAAMMLLQLTDWMGASVASAAGDQGAHFLALSGAAIGGLGVAVGSPFVTFLIGLLTAAAGMVLWVELLIREAAVYVIVLMLPLTFSAMVWPARRVWAIRAIEVLVALILAKFAIVSVLALAAAALGHAGGNLIAKSLAGLVLVLLGAFAPWVLLRLLPLAEVASAVAGHVRETAQTRMTRDASLGRHGVATVGEGVSALMGRMQVFHADASRAANGRLAGDETDTGGLLRPITVRDHSGGTRLTSDATAGAPATSGSATASRPAGAGTPPSASELGPGTETDTLTSTPSQRREQAEPPPAARHSEPVEPVEPAALEREAHPKLPLSDADERLEE